MEKSIMLGDDDLIYDAVKIYNDPVSDDFISESQKMKAHIEIIQNSNIQIKDTGEIVIKNDANDSTPNRPKRHTKNSTPDDSSEKVSMDAKKPRKL